MDKQPNWKWLDAETQSLLSGVVPNKLAPPTTETFSVVVLAQNNHLDQRQTIRAFDRILGTSHIDAVFQKTDSRRSS